MITTLSGSNHFLLQTELDRLVAGYIAEYSDFGLERLDGEEESYDRMREALESLPFLTSKKLVTIKSPGANKQFTEQAASLLENLSASIDVVIIEPKLDKRLSYYKFLKAHTEFKEFNELDGAQLARWVVAQAKEQEGEITLADARYLIDRIGLNQQLISQELIKLSSYSSTITKQTINLLTEKTPQSTIFDLIDSAFAGNVKKALGLYQEQRRMKVEPQQILAMIIWQLHVLAVVKTAGQRDAAEIARDARISPFVVRKTQNISRQLTLAKLKSLVEKVLTIDVTLKSQSVDADDALQELILYLGDLI